MILYAVIKELYRLKTNELEIGGAVRFNYNLSSWKEGQKKRGGDFGYDVFRINAKAKYKVKLNAEYRLRRFWRRNAKTRLVGL
jgi:hypothetical protein